jgi:AcrR family transcriptional regulator
METTTGGRQGTSTRRRPENITADLLEAATIEFASHGFDGASTRRIAERARAHQPQINYHLGSKELLWRATVTRLFDILDLEGSALAGSTMDIQVFSNAVRRFMQFSAEKPELNRIVNLEATSPSARLDWLVSTYLSPLFEIVEDAWSNLRRSGVGADLGAGEVWEIITSYGALHFANAPMLSMIDKSNPPDRSDPDIQANRVLRILFPTIR